MSEARVAELTQKLAESAAAVREAYAAMVSVISEMKEADIAHHAGYTRLSMFVAEVARLNPRVSSRLINHADAITEVMTPTGHVTPARLPVVREALLDGALDGEQVEAILQTVKKVPDHAPGDTADIVEKHLVDVARTSPASVIAKHGATLLARIDPDGDQPTGEALAEPKNVFRSSRDEAGWMHFFGSIEPESAEELDAMLGALARPDGPTDERPAKQRLGDAFCDVIHHAIDSPDLPTRGGEKPHLNATMDYTHLLKGVGTATLEGGVQLGAAAVRRIACDAGIVPMVMNGASVPLDVGRTRRLVTPKQRAALTARDRGCGFPACPRAARWSDAHHIKSWLDGGPTDLGNTVLLCRRHHRIIHHSEWEVRTTASGIPEFIPRKAKPRPSTPPGPENQPAPGCQTARAQARPEPLQWLATPAHPVAKPRRATAPIAQPRTHATEARDRPSATTDQEARRKGSRIHVPIRRAVVKLAQAVRSIRARPSTRPARNSSITAWSI